jgi:hypothetical protein
MKRLQLWARDTHTLQPVSVMVEIFLLAFMLPLRRSMFRGKIHVAD